MRADTCKVKHCYDPQRCFYQKARKEFFEADLLIVNHHLLLADLRSKGRNPMPHEDSLPTVLPNFSRLIIDEAHHLEDIAIQESTEETSNLHINRLLALLGTFHPNKQLKSGLLKTLYESAKQYPPSALSKDNHDATTLLDSYATLLKTYMKDAKNIFTEVSHYLLSLSTTEMDLHLRLLPGSDKMPSDWKERYEIPIGKLLYQLERIKNHLLKIHQFYCRFPGSRLKTTLFYLQTYITRLSQNNHLLSRTFEVNTPNEVKWISLKKEKNPFISIQASPLYVGEYLAENLFEPMKTTILTSATLKTLGTFDFYKERLGLERLAKERIFEKKLPSNFNYKSNCGLYVPSELPDPRNPHFNTCIVHYIKEAARVFKGRTLVLFTSYLQMQQTYKSLEEESDSLDVDLLVQGMASRSELLDRFKSSPKTLLMGVNSFWEGIDLKGQVLRCLIMVKFPFVSPMDPLHSARLERLEEQGKNPFQDYSIPLALIRFKQGFGRLIRSHWDKGLFVLLDNRIRTKAYGKLFLQALPTLHRFSGKNLQQAAQSLFEDELKM